MDEFLTPVQLGPYQLSNRLTMGAHSRMRAINYCPQPMMATYYQQRSAAGLIIAEPTLINQPNVPLPCCPGLFAREHVEAWRDITKSVHSGGGKIFAQLWHGCNLDYLCESHRGLASTLNLDIANLDAESLQREEVVKQFRRAAQNAIAADFDGIEIHGALRTLSRSIPSTSPSDDYLRAEGIMPDYTALIVELADVLSAIWDSDRVGVFLSPSPAFCDHRDTDPEATFYATIDALSYNRLAYIHLAESHPSQSILENPEDSVVDALRPLFGGVIIAASQDDLHQDLHRIRENKADLVSFRERFAVNPDLLDRIAAAESPAELTDTLVGELEESTRYTGGENGYLR